MVNREQHIESIIEGIYAIRRALMTHSSAKSFIAKHAKFSITPSQWALLNLIMEKEHISVKEIAKNFGITSSAATQLVDGLVEKKYVVRESDTNDRRASVVKVSHTYRKKMLSMKKKIVEHLTVIFNGLTSKELAQYAALNKKLTNSILNNKNKHDPST